MHTLLIFLTSLGAAVLANRLMRHGPLALADIACGIVAGCLGMGIAQILGVGGGMGLPLLIALCFPLGLQSFQRPAPHFSPDFERDK